VYILGEKKIEAIVFGCIGPYQQHDYVNQNVMENFFEFERLEF
jgi:hypothetical protein